MKIAAFNVQRLGWTKVNKEDVRDIIIKIISQYSVVLLEEVMDKTGPSGDPKDECSKAMPLLREHLNAYGDNKSNPYEMLCSEPLGPKGRQEKFVYFYRKKEVQIIRCYQYVEKNEDNEDDDEDDEDDEDYEDDDEDEEDDEDDDEDEDAEDVITRQPFVLLINCPNTVVQKLVLIPVHTKPRNAVAELNALHDVVEDVRKRWRTANIMILGDFNADGPYLSNEQKEALSISSAPYHWLIDDDAHTMTRTKTTTRNNNHAYDRIVVYGKRMLKAIVPDSAKAYNFRKESNLTEEEALSVSDHCPVEVKLEVKPEVKLEEQMGKLTMEPKAQRNRNPVRPSTGGRPPGAQKKKAGPAATKGKGV